METNRTNTPTDTGLTSEHKTIAILFFTLCLLVTMFTVSLAIVSMNEDKLAAEVAVDKGVVAAYCLYKAGERNSVCAILAAKEGGIK